MQFKYQNTAPATTRPAYSVWSSILLKKWFALHVKVEIDLPNSDIFSIPVLEVEHTNWALRLQWGTSVLRQYVILSFSAVALGGLAIAYCHWTQGSWVQTLSRTMDFVRAIKIHRITSFGGKVKPSVLCRKLLRHVKELYDYERYSYLVGKIQRPFLSRFILLCS
jgi:hypothetical protein